MCISTFTLRIQNFFHHAWMVISKALGSKGFSEQNFIFGNIRGFWYKSAEPNIWCIVGDGKAKYMRIFL